MLRKAPERMILPGILLALELSGQNDKGLALRLQAREKSAMGELYDRFGRLAFSVILGIVRDSSIAEDLTQETFLRVWNRIQAFDAERGALGIWLITIARNRAIDYVRSQSVRMERNIFELDVREHPSMFIDIERDLFNSDHSRLIKAAISRLPANQQKVIEFAYFEGLSQTEMAERMREPLGTIKTWVRSALKSLREELRQTVAA